MLSAQRSYDVALLKSINGRSAVRIQCSNETVKMYILMNSNFDIRHQQVCKLKILNIDFQTAISILENSK
jgi:hypothetical protein